MKKLFVAAVVVFAFAGSAFAQNAGFEMKVGTSYPKDVKKYGLNSSVSLGADLNPFFTIFAKPEFSWFNWDKTLGAGDMPGPLATNLKSSVNAFAFPLLAGAKVKFTDAKDSMGITPYISGAAGYSWMIYKYKVPARIGYPAENMSKTFKGFTWEVLGGFDYPFEGTNMSFGLEGGYRGMKLKKGSYEVDMSGFLVNAGVSFALGETQDNNN
jgi:hypothetical protein